MKLKEGDSLGVLQCEACGCCKIPTEHVVYNDGFMSCKNCGCRAPRTDTQTYFRIYIRGRLTLSGMEEILRIARLVGASDKDFIIRNDEDNTEHYIEIDPKLMLSNIEFRQMVTAGSA